MPTPADPPNTESTTAPVPAPSRDDARASLPVIYLTLLRWNLASIGTLLPLLIVVQGLMAAGIVVGFGLLIPDIDPATALFLSTGAPTILLLTVGLVMVPQGVAQARANGTFTYQRSLPSPRILQLLADLTMWSLVSLPSIAVAIGIASLRFELSLSFDWPVLIGAGLLVTVTGTAVGYAIAVLLPPMLAQLVSQVLVFFVLLFSPISYPASRLPQWFQSVHDVLPVRPAADLLRAGIAADVYDASGRDLLVLTLWCLAGLVITMRALSRRG